LNFYIPLGRLHGIIQQAKILRLKADHVVVHQGDVGSWYVYVTSIGMAVVFIFDS